MTSFQPPSKPLSFAFRAFGSTLRVDSNDEALLNEVRAETERALVNKIDFVEPHTAMPDRIFGLYQDANVYRLYEDGEPSTYGESRQNFIKFYNAIVRVAVGEHSNSLVFLHAGVVGWKGKAIVLPANSFSGKTTLVAELVKLGAEYYSDEYAVIDELGLVHPFERDLSIRTDDAEFGETRVPVETIGGRAGSDPLPIGTLLITRFDPSGSFKPVQLTLGTAILETIPFAITVLRRPDRTVKRLNLALADAERIRTDRGEAAETAELLLSHIESHG